MLSRSASPQSSGQDSSRKSGRRHSKKVRTGCITCKIRKVKCDETKPFCQRCTKTGRRCEGYVSHGAGSRGFGFWLSPSTIPDMEADGLNPQVFHYYTVRLAPVLVGSTAESFWTGMVLKLSLTEPAVRHCVLALSSLHDHFAEKKQRSWNIAVSEYSRAITLMRQWSPEAGNEPSVIPLVVCLLFICIEFLSARDAAAQMHICQGRKLLSELTESSTSSLTLDAIKQNLVPIYTRLSLASHLFGSHPETIPHQMKTLEPIPSEFSTIRDCRVLLYQLLDEGLEFSTQTKALVFDPNVDPMQLHQMEMIQQGLLSQLEKWRNAFTVFDVKTLSAQDQKSAQRDVEKKVLLLYYHCAVIWTSTWLQTEETAYDSYATHFGSIISLCAGIIHARQEVEEVFSFESEVIGPLYWTALKCRHPYLRREALRLLMQQSVTTRRENLWDAKVDATVAARIISLEENGPGATEWSQDTNTPPSLLSILGASGMGYPDNLSDKAESDEEEIRVPFSNFPSLAAPTLNESLDSGSMMDDVVGLESPLYNQDHMAKASRLQYAAHESTDTDERPLQSESNLVLPSHRTGNVEPPYGVPEKWRMKNVNPISRTNDGIWIVMFMEPDDGQSEWKVIKQFVKFES